MAQHNANQTASKLIVTMTIGELEALLDRHREETLADVRALTGAVAAPTNRQGAADFLGVSLAQLDYLVREKNLPFHKCGDSKRFIREELIAWLRGGQ